MRIILGSQSPRRKEILSFFSLPFVQIPSAFDENSICFIGSPKDYAMEISSKKAQILADKFPNDLIISADTVVFFEGNIYNKPRDEEEAFSMLQKFSGKWQQVFTAHTVRKGEKFYCGYEETRILFNPLTEQQIRLYHSHCPSLDKAGAYAIQRAGSILIAKIEGCYYSAMGLSINCLRELLSKFEINLWMYLEQC